MTTRVYINTDTWITLTPGDGFVMADVVSASITFSRSGGAETLTLTSTGGGIVLGGSTMTVKIPDSAGITVAGVYSLRITFVDTSGNLRGLEPVDTEFIRFY
jgi:hypothetical protein